MQAVSLATEPRRHARRGSGHRASGALGRAACHISAADAATSALLYGQHHGETHQAPLFTKLGFDGPRVQKGMTQPLGESNASSHDGERMNARAYSLL